jgi:PPOX class probable F420-dependent enzyme
MAQLTPDQAKLFTEGQNFAHLATVNKDGTPQVTPVWIDFDGTHVLVNSEQKRRKTRNMQRNPNVALSLQPADNPYTYVEVRGKVVEITPEGGFEHIDKMAKKYMGQDSYPWNKPDDVRVIVKIQPEHISGM